MATDKTTSKDELEDEEHEEEEEEEEDEEEEEERPVKKTAAPSPAAKVTAARSDNAGALSSIRNTWTIAKRELRAYFDSLVAYVVIGLSMLGLGGYFFFYQGGFWQVDRATMMRLFDFAPGALCLVVRRVTMAMLAEEKRSGTIELLI